MSLSIYKNKNGGWRGDLEAYGQRKSKVKKTKVEIQRWAQEMEREIFLDSKLISQLHPKVLYFGVESTFYVFPQFGLIKLLKFLVY